MAYTGSIISRTVFGNKRVVILSCVADAASGNVSGGVGVVEAISFAPVSMATAAPRMKINVLEAGTSAAGSIGISGCTNGDVFYLTVYGR